MTAMDTADITLEGLIHDLNNVFQTISEHAELLASDPKWKRVAGGLERCVERGKRIAGSIVESSRASTELAAELAPVVDRAVESARDYLEGAHATPVNFQSRIDPGFRLPGSPAAWERVLVNLFLNAAEAGATRVDIRATDYEISIDDDGAGISPELLPRIFEPHVSSKSAVSGLGLSIVQSIVEKNGWLVSARNREQGGATFTINVSR
jgi:signal transduction histidine kinase